MEVTWLLAFDDSCPRCSELSMAVMEASDGKIAVIPLLHPQAVEWRRKAFGTSAPWAPTLLAVESGGAVRGYSGKLLVLYMARHLGIKSTVRVLKTLGDLRRAQLVDRAAPPRSSISRPAFLRIAGGVITAVAFSSGFSSTDAVQATAARWVEQNTSSVPHTYDGLNSLAPEYRLAFFRTFTPEERRMYWLDNLSAFRRARPSSVLTARQGTILAGLESFFRTTPSFAAGVDSGTHAKITTLRSDIDGTFSNDDARTLLLGTIDPQLMTANVACSCSSRSDYCPSLSHCRYPKIGGCTWLSYGCGTFYNYPCDGFCTS